MPEDYDPGVPSRERILQFLRAAEGPAAPEELAQSLGAATPLSQGFSRRLKAMERDGQLFFNPQGQVLINTRQDFISGRVQGHRDGFGFLLRDDGGPDLFLAPREMRKVLHGDRVRVRAEGEYRGRPEAVILEVMERCTDRLVGRYLKERGAHIVVPEDQRIKHDILVPAAERGTARHGQVVTVEIMEQPTRHTQPLGRIVEVLGEIDDPGMEIEIAVRKFHVPHEFSGAALQEADRTPDAVRPQDLAGRVDLRDVPFITIDGEDARDFDDAVFCAPVALGAEKNPQPGWRLLVAIADVSDYVRPDSALDANARERGTSVYFPRRVIPMLPEALSNGICSLNPQVDRLVLVCDMVIWGKGARCGQVKAYQFYEAVIRSQARTTYTDIWAALQQPLGPAALRLGDLLAHVQDAHALFHAFEAARQARGAMAFDTVETRIVANDMGKIERIEPALRNDAHRLIEECMLTANTCAADFMQRNKRLGLYRVHEGPTPDRLLSLREFLRNLGLSLGGDETPSTRDYAVLLDAARHRPDFEIVQMMCLRSMQQAIYTPENSGHFGLAYTHYAHFTSPIRRYPDLLTHRVIKSILARQRYTPEVDDPGLDPALPAAQKRLAAWEKLGLMLSACERRADDATRDVEAWLKCWFVREHVGEVFSGRITGVAPFGLFVTLDSLYVEGMVHVSELGSDYFQYNESMHELRGERTGIRYRLTDAVHVQVARVDLEARRIDFRLVKETSFKALTTPEPAAAAPRKVKKAASAKPEALKGTTAQQRRAEAKRSARAPKAVKKSARKSTTDKSTADKRR